MIIGIIFPSWLSKSALKTCCLYVLWTETDNQSLGSQCQIPGQFPWELEMRQSLLLLPGFIKQYHCAKPYFCQHPKYYTFSETSVKIQLNGDKDKNKYKDRDKDKDKKTKIKINTVHTNGAEYILACKIFSLKTPSKYIFSETLGKIKQNEDDPNQYDDHQEPQNQVWRPKGPPNEASRAPYVAEDHIPSA